MNTNKLFEMALGIDSPWFIEKIEFNDTSRQLNIFIDFKKGSKFFYQSSESDNGGNFKVHDTKQKKWRHLNFFQHECFLQARVPRIKLPNGKVRLIRTPWEGKTKGFTLLFESLLLQLLISMPVLAVSRITKVSDDKLWRLLEKYIDEALSKRDLKKLTKIGIDETSRKRGHNYISLFVDLLKKKTVYISEGKDYETVENFREDLHNHNGDAENISDVSCDMSPAFIKGVKLNFPNAEITFDKFHLIKMINKAVDKVRKKEAKEQDILKKSRYSILKNDKNLTKKQRQKKEELEMSKLNLKTVRAMHIRENFQLIYKADSKEDFEILLKKWYFWATHSRIEPIKKVAYSIKRHWEGILKWKESLINNGILEGLNSVIQAAKSKARGYKTTKCFKLIAYLITANLDFSSINKYYLST